MNTKKINLTSAEWSVMEYLWEKSPLTGRDMTQQMHEQMGWSRSTTLTLLSRLEAKSAVISDSQVGKKTFRPLLRREDAAMQETKELLGRVYNGSLSLMVSSLTRKQSLPQEEIDELYAILREMEVTSDD